MKKNICLIASCGGHLMEMLQLLPAVEKYPFYIVTEKNTVSIGLVKPYRHYFLLQQERKSISFVFRFLYNIFASLVYLLINRPKIIVTTGAGAVYPTCRIGKWLGSKIIYIESFAKHDSPSTTGKLVHPFADAFFVQWPKMQTIYENSRYDGTVY